MNKKTILTLALVFSLFGGLYAQIVDDYEENVGSKVKAARVAYITERLGMTPEESSAFWALNNQFEQERRAIRAQYKPKRGVETMSDTEASQFIEQRFEMEQKLLNLKKAYYPKFKAIISPAKIALFSKAEREFRKTLLRKLGEKRKNNRKRRFGNN
ncbi:MAG: hypothetical protein AAF798_17770 [Bacteroidota bacterium]